MLSIHNLHVSVDEKEILKGVDLEVKPGEVHVIMGPNGSGKSTLAYTLAGHPRYKIMNDELRIMNNEKTQETKEFAIHHSPLTISIDGENLFDKTPDQRAKMGLFLAFQYPVAIEGVTVLSFLRQTHQTLFPQDKLALFEFRELVQKEARDLNINKDLLNRSLNAGFSGGEKKRIEILQLRILKPKYAICDETDSGLDIDALKTVALGINKSVKETNMGCLVITHYQRILNYLKPDFVHIMANGKIAKSGGLEVLESVEKNGYKEFITA